MSDNSDPTNLMQRLQDKLGPVFAAMSPPDRAQALADMADTVAAQDADLAWSAQLRTGPFYPLITRISAALGGIEYDSEHRMIYIARPNHGFPSQLDSVEIYVRPGRQARFCCTYVARIGERGNRVFRNTRLKPVTIKALRRVLRDARRGGWHDRAHVPQPGQLAADLGLPDVELEPRITALERKVAKNAAMLRDAIEMLDEAIVLGELAGEDGVARATRSARLLADVVAACAETKANQDAAVSTEEVREMLAAEFELANKRKPEGQ